MFTGIVTAIGQIARVESGYDSARITIAPGKFDFSDVVVGDSIAVSGPCLTVVSIGSDAFVVDVSSETMARTTLGNKAIGQAVNLEKALKLSDRLGGHLVSGHVDGVGQVVKRVDLEDYVQLQIEAPVELARYIASKGSISLDGVSLTVNDARETDFDLMIIPHTLKETTLGSLHSGHQINLEIDLIARYLERLQKFAKASDAKPLNLDTLQQRGFSSP
ncbi:MAG TPA: riboflavin synthase [Gammaproteobacteria bacterium]|nr:riboflavin synthase [Gammaproteobacteria bacterium]